MSSMMQAAVVKAFDKSLTLRDWEVPTAGRGQLLVKTEACGVWHTDLHAARGDWPVEPLSAIDDVFDRLQPGKVPPRVVLDLGHQA